MADRAASILVPGVLHRLIVVATLVFVFTHIAACVHVLGGDVLLWLDVNSPPDTDTFLGSTVVAFLDAHQALSLRLLSLDHLLVLLQAFLECTGELEAPVLDDI